ncbi:RNA polymerase sigma factor [Caldalkalibacillus mannanilyticus]|uniref:RNA polymerase sigma factor n=1 Tax=Caldalkalibacillus mannanilyticus TaxID=1418 RepID=UPI000468545E|nr:RNA polymerase sigma factor [Caldalkalibacillus mannanilyticus]
MSEIRKFIYEIGEGSPEWFFKTYYRRVHYLAYSMLGDYHLAEDITLEVLYKAFKNLHKVRSENEVMPWIATITKRTTIDYIRKRKKLNELVNENTVMDIIVSKNQNNLTVENELHNYNISEMLEQEISRLPRIFKEVIVLKYFLDFNIEEIVCTLNINKSTVKSRLFRARTRLKECLEEKVDSGLWNL